MAKAKKKAVKKKATKSRKTTKKSVSVKDLTAKAAKSIKRGMAAVRQRLA